MSNIYSALIFEGHDLGDLTPVLLEEGFVYVIRSMDAFAPGPNDFAHVNVIAAAVSATFWVADFGEVENTYGASRTWVGRQVFVPNGEIDILIESSSALGGCDLRISGWKLTPP